MRIIRVVAKYAALALGIALAACLLLYLAGLAPQQAVRAHLLESMPQLQSEGLAPGVLYDGHPRSKLDNFSENYILAYSYYMDTRNDPGAVLSNPGRQMHDPYDELFLQTEEWVRGELPPDTHYTRYWMGFRMVVRPMLAIMNYMDARQCILWGFVILLGAVTIALYRQTKSALIALAFPAAISQLNPIAIASCFQYSACFYIAFAGMLLVPAVRGRRFTVPMLFFTLGMVTQIFDFYTAPLLTCGLPMLFLLQCNDGSFSQPVWKRLLLCLAAWLAGYAGAWLLKMLLTTVLTPYNAFYDGVTRLLFWLDPAQGGGERFLAWKAIYWCTINILDLLPLVIEAAILLLYAVTIMVKRPGRRVFLDNLPCLAVALLPFVWFAVSARPSYEHFYFQYRSLGIFLFGGLVFLLRTAGWDKLFSERALPEQGAER